MVSIIGIGDNTVDLYVNKGILFPGGNAVNVAVLAHRCGAKTAYLGCLGKDVAGKHVYGSLNAEKIDVSHCRLIEGHNAWSQIFHHGNDRVFGDSSRGVQNNYNLGPDDFAFLSTFDLAHSSIYSDLEEDLEEISAAASMLSFDYSDSTDPSFLEATAPFVDIAFLSPPQYSEDDCHQLAHHIRELGPSLVIITRGEEGALAYDGNHFWSQGIIETQVVDTLGAGDGFIAGFLVEFLANQNLSIALKQGAQVASNVCSYLGAFGYEKPLHKGQPGIDSSGISSSQD